MYIDDDDLAFFVESGAVNSDGRCFFEILSKFRDATVGYLGDGRVCVVRGD